MYIAAFAAVLLASCQPDDPIDPLASYDSSHVGATITISRNSWTAPVDSGRVAIKITSSYTWILDIPDDAKSWITASQMWGDSLQTYKIYLHAATNNTPEPRQAKVTVRSGKAKKVIVFKYRPKKDSKSLRGHRQPYTKVKIEKIAL